MSEHDDRYYQNQFADRAAIERAGNRTPGPATYHRRFGPKAPEHPSVGRECPACHVPFAAGDYTTLIALGPGDDPDDQRAAREGRAYNAVASEVHWTCATGEDV